MPTADTLPAVKSDLRPRKLGLRVLAEDAAKGAALEKDYAAHAWPVFQALPLDVHDKGDFVLPCHSYVARPSLRFRSLTMNQNFKMRLIFPSISILFFSINSRIS